MTGPASWHRHLELAERSTLPLCKLPDPGCDPRQPEPLVRQQGVELGVHVLAPEGEWSVSSHSIVPHRVLSDGHFAPPPDVVDNLRRYGENFRATGRA